MTLKGKRGAVKQSKKTTLNPRKRQHRRLQPGPPNPPNPPGWLSGKQKPKASRGGKRTYPTGRGRGVRSTR